jgi:hypothetical protein
MKVSGYVPYHRWKKGRTRKNKLDKYKGFV